MNKTLGWTWGLTLCILGSVFAQTPSWTWHTVKKGETLYQLARRHQTTVAHLCRLNGFSTPRLLRIGERLKVPVRSAPKAAGSSPQSKPPHPIPRLPNPSPIQRVLQVQVGKAVVLTVPTLRSVSIANPEIADVQILTAETVGVLGKKVGSTSLILVTTKRTMLMDVQVTPEPLLRERLQALIGIPTVRVEVVKDALLLTGSVPSQSDKERVIALARLFVTTVLDLLRVEEPPKPPKPPLPSPEEIERAIGIEGIKARFVEDTLVLEGTVKTPDDVTRAEKVAALLAPKVVNLVQARPMSAQEMQALIAIPTVKVKETPEALVMEGEVHSQEELQRINELAGQARRKVVNWVKVVPPPPPPPPPSPPDFATRVKEAIGIPTIEVKGDEKGLVLMGTVETQAEKEKALRITRFLLGLPPIPTPTGAAPSAVPQLVLPGVGVTTPTAPNPAPPAQPQAQILDLIEVKGGKQIRVELRLVEINRTALRDLGIDYPALAAPGVSVGQAAKIDSTLQPSVSGVTGIAQRTPVLAFLRALEQKNAARTLSAPNTVVLSGQEAKFNVGGEIPIPIATVAPGIGTTTAVEFRPFGIVLTVVPTIEPTGKINLKVTTEVSELDFTIAVTIAGATIPGKRVRTATTQVELTSDETLVMSGLVQRVQQELINRVPILSKIPILGELFTSRRFQQGETELAILVTPTILQPTP